MAPSSTWNPDQMGDLLPVYYRRLFPYKHYTKWLHYGKPSADLFARREFAFILADDVHLRYRSYPDALAFERDAQQMLPHKIDIGAVYTASPRDHRKLPGFAPVERELIFDIDLTDYNDIRTCCDGAGICKKCWKLMVIAIETIDTALADDFGFAHRLWLFSGRRGVHCWVADQRVRRLPNIKRSQIADYLTVVLGSEKQTKRVTVPHSKCIHHSLLRAYRLATGQIDGRSDLFAELCAEQRWLEDEAAGGGLQTPIDAVVKLYADPESREQLRKELLQLPDCLTRYWFLRYKFDPDSCTKLKADLRKQFDKSTFTPAPRCKWFVHEFVLQYSYPRLDVNVSKSINHLLKSPFCVHPKTGCIAVPINPKLARQFDPTAAPRLELVCISYDFEIVEEAGVKMDENGSGDASENSTTRKALDYKRTSLAEYVDHFEQFVNRLTAGATSGSSTGLPVTTPAVTNVENAMVKLAC